MKTVSIFGTPVILWLNFVPLGLSFRFDLLHIVEILYISIRYLSCFQQTDRLIDGQMNVQANGHTDGRTSLDVHYFLMLGIQIFGSFLGSWIGLEGHVTFLWSFNWRYAIRIALFWEPLNRFYIYIFEIGIRVVHLCWYKTC